MKSGGAAVANGAQENQPIATLTQLEELEKELHGNLITTEKDIYNTEIKYIKLTQNTSSNGNIFKGWDAGANATRPTNTITTTTGRRAARNPNHEKLFFSLSSLSAPKNDEDLKSKQSVFQGTLILI